LFGVLLVPYHKLNSLSVLLTAYLSFLLHFNKIAVCSISVDDLYVIHLLINLLNNYTVIFLLFIIAEFNERHSRQDNRRRSDRSREHSRERYYDQYDSRYADYYRAAYAHGEFVFFAHILMVHFGV